jgi:hypothetical protein
VEQRLRTTHSTTSIDLSIGISTDRGVLRPAGTISVTIIRSAIQKKYGSDVLESKVTFRYHDFVLGEFQNSIQLQHASALRVPFSTAPAALVLDTKANLSAPAFACGDVRHVLLRRSLRPQHH